MLLRSVTLSSGTCLALLADARHRPRYDPAHDDGDLPCPWLPRPRRGRRAVATTCVAALSPTISAALPASTPGSLVLDLGSGGGILARSLAAAGARVLAVELDPARGRGAAQPVRGSEPLVEVVEGDAAPRAAAGAVQRRREPAVRRRHGNPARAPRRSARPRAAGRRHRRVGARGEAHRGLAVDAARLRLGRMARAESRASCPAYVLRPAAVGRRRRPPGRAPARAARPGRGGGELPRAAAARVRRANAARPRPAARHCPPGRARARLRPTRAAARPRRAPVGSPVLGDGGSL